MIEESQTTLQDKIFERYSKLTSNLEKFRKNEKATWKENEKVLEKYSCLLYTSDAADE